jgi:hypothetical protein
MFDIKIYGVPKRNENIEKLASKLLLSDSDIFYDDRPNGGNALYTALKVYNAPCSPDLTHRIVLQDDIEICNNFRDICNNIIATHPDKIIMLFPVDNAIEDGVDLCELNNTPYLEASMPSGCGYILPVQHMKNFAKAVHKDAIEDVALFGWARKNNILILNTVPALIQHIGDESIIYKKAPIRRTRYFEENPIANWKSKIIIQ